MNEVVNQVEGGQREQRGREEEAEKHHVLTAAGLSRLLCLAVGEQPHTTCTNSVHPQGRQMHALLSF